MHHAFDPEHPTVSNYFGGAWYSTPALAMCGAGRQPGDKKARVPAFFSLSVFFKENHNKDTVYCLLSRNLPLVVPLT